VPAPHHSVSLGQAALVGGVAGLLGGLFGVGGGFIIVPGLIAVAGMDRRLAHGTSMAATLPIAIGSFLTYLVHGNVDFTVALFLTVGSMVGAVAGTHLLRVIPQRILIIVFIVTVLATAARLLVGSDSSGRGDLTMTMTVLLVLLGFVTGVLSGLLGIGGGVVRVPAMVVVLDMGAAVAKGTSSAVIIPTALVGTARNRKHGNVDLRTAGIVGIFGAATAVVGGTISDRLSNSLSNSLFAILLLAVAGSQLISLRSLNRARAGAEPVAGH
jgi:uncharacterized membrane protein YfcA